MDKNKKLGLATKAIHAGNLEEPVFGEVSVPVFQSSTFSFPTANEGAARFAGESDGFIYTRMGNPTTKALEDNVAALEGGFKGLATASGMAAVTTVFLTFLSKDDHIVCTDSVYGPTRMVLEREFSRFGVQATFVDTSDINNLRNAIRVNTKMVYVESPANPTINITDIHAAAETAHLNGAIFVVDNTFASPYLQRPMEMGADIVIHSLTKFINGHSDVVGGMIVVKNENQFKKIRPVLNAFGGTMDPHQAWLILRGVRTLALRIEKAQANAEKMAHFLKNHPNVTWVTYPGLESHPQHQLAKKQMDGFGAMISFGVKNGLEGGKTVMDNVKLFTLAVSLGGVESLIEHPASMTHATIPRAERLQANIKDELVRMAVGCEDFEDLKDDIDQALSMIRSDKNEKPESIKNRSKESVLQ
ncbi:MAG: PLP-dependent transferase [Calditrichaeota bacterium]|nr:PLP-dependent transferase [Calditrichota bacterium]